MKKNKNYLLILLQDKLIFYNKIQYNKQFYSLLERESDIPLMKTKMELQIPITLINPNLDDIQSHFSQVLNNILDCHKHITMWGQRVKKKVKTGLKFSEQGIFLIFISANINFMLVLTDKQGVNVDLRNYYKTVSEHKEIVRIFMGLQGAMYLLQPDVVRLLQVQ